MEDRALRTLFERFKESVSPADEATDGADADGSADESSASAADGSIAVPASRVGADLFE